MRRIRVLEALNSQGPAQQLLVKGWVRTRRDAKGVSFLELNDGSCLNNLQVVIDESALGAESLTGVSTGAAVEVEGALVESPGKGTALGSPGHPGAPGGSGRPRYLPAAEETAHR